eukprot:TCALIF_12019-PA protein Name:"Similar to Lztfl1 Leucine zipper transcription factor-like protein 1 (Rattus norvegicus)" AED:0.04 eAED:0.04 QI:0/0.8/0.66/0.83/0.8/0.66/6/99/314
MRERREKCKKNTCINKSTTNTHNENVSSANLFIFSLLSTHRLVRFCSRFLDPTYTVDEVKDILSDIAEAVLGEIELELINFSHTNVLLLQQVFRQSEKWHLNLEADLAELENRELLDKVKNWEENELASQPVEKPNLSPKKRLAPLNQGGPVQLLNKQIEELDEENKVLRERLKTVEEKAKAALKEKDSLASQLEDAQKDTQIKPNEPVHDNEDQSKEIDELTETVKLMRNQMTTEIEMKEKSAAELETNLTTTKHALLDVQHQLSMAEKELEKKFSQTGAYKNLKMMMNSKNDQIKDLRNKLAKYEKDDDEEE